MKKLVGLISKATIYFCVATVIAQVAALSAFWAKGALDQGRIYRVLAALHGIDLLTMHTQLVAKDEASTVEQPSHEAKLEFATLKSLDMDLREMAYNKGLLDVQSLLSDLQIEKDKFDKVKESWVNKLEAFDKLQKDESKIELQRTLEAMKAVQAKEQLVKMVEKGDIDLVVTLLKKMAIDKRKKIIAEFKLVNESEMLQEILDMMGKGEPIASEVDATKGDFDKVDQGG